MVHMSCRSTSVVLLAASICVAFSVQSASSYAGDLQSAGLTAKSALPAFVTLYSGLTSVQSSSGRRLKLSIMVVSGPVNHHGPITVELTQGAAPSAPSEESHTWSFRLGAKSFVPSPFGAENRPATGSFMGEFGTRGPAVPTLIDHPFAMHVW
jgi:hypothetical protein